jgi:cell division septation protein DedD
MRDDPDASRFGPELRAHLRGANDKERIRLLKEDRASLHATLAAPWFLSGVPKTTHARLLDETFRSRHEGVAKTLDDFAAAREANNLAFAAAAEALQAESVASGWDAAQAKETKPAAKKPAWV